jgi:hypothetical protein
MEESKTRLLDRGKFLERTRALMERLRAKEAKSRFRLTAPRVKLAENDVERACIDVLRFKGITWCACRVACSRLPTAAGSASANGPDYVCVKRDFFLE